MVPDGQGEEEEENEEEEGSHNFFLTFLLCADAAMWADDPVFMLVLRSSTDCRTSSCAAEIGTHSANCVPYVGVPLVQNLVWLLTRPLLCNDRCHGRPFIPAYMANEVVAAPVADTGSCMFMAGFSGLTPPPPSPSPNHHTTTTTPQPFRLKSTVTHNKRRVAQRAMCHRNA